MSGTNENAVPRPNEQSEDPRLWRTAVAIMAFDVDGGGALESLHRSGQTGTLSADDNLNGRIRLVDARSGEVSAYDSVADAVEDGWSLETDVARRL